MSHTTPKEIKKPNSSKQTSKQEEKQGLIEENRKNKIIKLLERPIIQRIDKNTALIILSLIIPFMRLFMEEDTFRFLLGVLSCFTRLTNKDIASCAGCSPKRVQSGRKEVLNRHIPSLSRRRKPGGGRKCTRRSDTKIRSEIIRYVELRSYGPCTKGTREYTAATIDGIRKMLQRRLGETISETTIRNILRDEHIQLRTNKKLLYGNAGKETDAQKVIRHLQFDYIYSVREKVNDPHCIVLSIDCKKKEVLGPYSRISGKSYTLPGLSVKVNEHDFMTPLKVATLKDEDDLLDRQEGKAIPYGIYDLAMNKAYISVGISHDTPEFVVASIFRFFYRIKKDHPQAKRLYLLCDGGGSNNSRSDAFKFQIALLSKQIGMPVEIVHYPPYRSKFNPIERQVFAYISKRFERGPLYNMRTVLNEIRGTTTQKGLRVEAELDTKCYELKQKPTPEQMKLFQIRLTDKAHPENTLSYEIDGTGISDSDVPKIELPTVFDLKKDIDLSKEEKEKLREKQAREKADRKIARETKKATKELEAQARKKAREARRIAKELAAQKRAERKKAKEAKSAANNISMNKTPGKRGRPCKTARFEGQTMNPDCVPTST